MYNDKQLDGSSWEQSIAQVAVTDTVPCQAVLQQPTVGRQLSAAVHTCAILARANSGQTLQTVRGFLAGPDCC